MDPASQGGEKRTTNPTAEQDEPRAKARRTRWGEAPPADAQVAAAASAAASGVTAALPTVAVPPLSSALASFDVGAAAAAAKLALEKAKRVRELQVQMQANLASLQKGGASDAAMASAGAAAAASLSRQRRDLVGAVPVPKSVKFDHLGRQVDESGNAVAFKPQIHSTLKVNIAREREAKLKETFEASRIDKTLSDPSRNPWFDSSLAGVAGSVKTRKKGLRFVEPGYFLRKEESIVRKAQVDALNRRLAARAADGGEGEKKRKGTSFRVIEAWARKQRESAGGDDEERAAAAAAVKPDDEENVKLESDVKLETDDTGGAGGAEGGGGGVSGEAGSGGVVFKEEEDVKELVAPNLVPLGKMMDLRRQRPVLRHRDLIPEVEWWDVGLLSAVAVAVDADVQNSPPRATSLASAARLQYTPCAAFPYKIVEDRISSFVEHPVPLPPPTADAAKVVVPVMHLTPQERAKLRRRKKMEKERDKQDKIRMGLIAPPPPKTKLANLMRVLGDQAVSDPSKVEAQVKADIQQRLQDHIARNEARKLAPEERSKRHAAKWQQMGSEHHAMLVVVKNLAHRKFLYKVDRNAQQLHLSGAAVICPGLPAVLVVEGGPRSIKRFRRLVKYRVKWYEVEEENEDEGDADENDDDDDDEEDETGEEKIIQRNAKYCMVVWEGVVKERSFKNWKVHTPQTEGEARKLLADRQAEFYWEMAKNVLPQDQSLISS